MIRFLLWTHAAFGSPVSLAVALDNCLGEPWEILLFFWRIQAEEDKNQSHLKIWAGFTKETVDKSGFPG